MWLALLHLAKARAVRAGAKDAARRGIDGVARFLHEPLGAVNCLNVDDNQHEGCRSYDSDDRTCDGDEDYGGNIRTPPRRYFWFDHDPDGRRRPLKGARRREI